MSDPFLISIWDPQTHKAPKMTFPQGAPKEHQRGLFICVGRHPQDAKNPKISEDLGRPTYCDSGLPLRDNELEIH